MLIDLAEKYPCAIVTGRPRIDCVILKLVGLDDVLKYASAWKYRKAKTDPSPVQKAQIAWHPTDVGSKRDDIFMFGDTVDDNQQQLALLASALGCPKERRKQLVC